MELAKDDRLGNKLGGLLETGIGKAVGVLEGIRIGKEVGLRNSTAEGDEAGYREGVAAGFELAHDGKPIAVLVAVDVGPSLGDGVGAPAGEVVVGSLRDENGIRKRKNVGVLS